MDKNAACCFSMLQAVKTVAFSLGASQENVPCCCLPKYCHKVRVVGSSNWLRLIILLNEELDKHCKFGNVI